MIPWTIYATVLFVLTSFFSFISGVDGSDHEEYLKSDDEDSFFGNDFKTKKQSLKDVKNLPEKLFVAIECLLDDINEKVRLAAAITIFTVERNKKTPKAKEKVFFFF